GLPPRRRQSRRCGARAAAARSVLGDNLHLPVEAGGPPEDPGLGRVRAGAVLEAARARRLPLAADQRWRDAADRIAARRTRRRNGLVAVARSRCCAADGDVVSAVSTATY